MTTTSNNQNAAREAGQIEIVNAYLASIPADKHPETSFRERIVSVAYSARGFYEATTINGNVESVSKQTVLGWLENKGGN